MKKLLLLSLAFTLAVTACKKKSKEEEVDPAFKLPYSNSSTEQNKEKLETAGIQFIEKINGLPDEKCIDVLSYFGELGPISPSVSSVLSIGEAASSKNIRGIVNAKVFGESSALSKAYRIYSWNHATQEWDESPSTSKLEYRFPSDEAKTTNNATLTFTYVASNIKPEVDGQNVELPASATVVLKVSGKEEFKFSSIYEYRPNGTPTKIENNILLGSYYFNSKLANDGSTASMEFSLLKGTEKLMGFNFKGAGNTDIDAIKNSMDPTAIVTNANASFEIMNFKIVGMVDIKGVSNAIADAANLPAVEQVKKEAEAWNKYSALVAVNTTENAIIAKTEFVGVSDQFDSYVDARLVFKDGSKMALDEFFEDGFADLVDEFEDFADNF